MVPIYISYKINKLTNSNKHDRFNDEEAHKRASLKLHRGNARKCICIIGSRDPGDDARDVSISYEVLLACVHASGKTSFGNASLIGIASLVD